jgi:hypothetical protein
LTQSYERPDAHALQELGDLLQNLGEELAAWRRRSLKAEAELAEARSRGGVVAGPELIQSRQRSLDLDLENQALHQRIAVARERLVMLANRLSFLEADADEGAA